ncbi:MAG: maleylpyruvate isomerase family mycothiol-dependent enzyme [Acidimicrobiales bacterium]
MVGAPDGWERNRMDITTTAGGIAQMMRGVWSADIPVPGLAWSVGQVGAHLVTLPRRYRRVMRDPEPFPSDLSALNTTELATVGQHDPEDLADLLEAEVDELLADLGDDGARTVPFFSMEHSVAGVGGVLLSELLVHGWDLARVERIPWPITADQARSGLRGLLPTVPHQIGPATAAGTRGTLHLRLRPDEDWTIEMGDGSVSVESGRPGQADVHVSTDPATFLLVAYGRVSRRRARFRAGLVGYGRKPWLSGPLTNLLTAA